MIEQQIRDIAYREIRDHEARHHKDAQPERRNCECHKDGEPCELPVCYRNEEMAKGYRFEYTGEYRLPKKDDWFVIDNTIINTPLGFQYYKVWILRAIPKVRRPHCTVTVYDGGDPYTYTFYGTPDLKRVFRETRLGEDEGAQLVLVESDEPFASARYGSVLGIKSNAQVYFVKVNDESVFGWPTFAENIEGLHLTDGDEIYLDDLIAAVRPKEQPEPWTPQVGDVVTGNETKEYAVITRVWDNGNINGFYESGEYMTGPPVRFSKATPEETACFYTLTGKDGEKARMYRDGDGDIVVKLADGKSLILLMTTNKNNWKVEAKAALAYFGITPDSPLIMAAGVRKRMYGDKYPAPEGNE